MNKATKAERIQMVVDGLAGLSTKDIQVVLQAACESLAETRMDTDLNESNWLFGVVEAIGEV